MTRLEYAQQLFGYDPDVTPQRELECATRWLREAKFRYESNRKTLAELDDNAVYEWWYDGGADIHRATKREIVKRTPRQIRLAPEYRWEKQTFLPRQQLEAGECVRHGKGWGGTNYVFGLAIRPELKEQLDKSVRRLENCRASLQRVELAIINDGILVSPRQEEMIDLMMSLAAKSEQSDTMKVNWKQEGF
jgi:hypothetical protein